MARPKGPWPSKPPRPIDQWRHLRTRARALGAPPVVMLVLDSHVEFFALNRHLTDPIRRIGYGRHSEAEREWDRRRRRKLIAEGEVPRRRLVQFPTPQRDGLAELLGRCRRSAIRAGQWLALHQLARVRHRDAKDQEHVHPVPVRRTGPHAGRELVVGRGGCKAGGIGLAGEWVPWDFSPPPPPPPPQPEPEPERPAGAVSIERMAELRRGVERSRGP